MDEFVVGPSDAAIARNREFWGGRTGLTLMMAPGVVIVVVGIVLTVLYGTGYNFFFGIVIVLSGLIGLWSGWATHVRDRDRAAEAVWIFRLDAEGVHFPRQFPTAWADARFVLAETDGEEQLLVTPQGYAFTLDRLDRTPAEIEASIVELSGGTKTLERT
ncbi:hypothetical protein GCM10027418_05830 [Mariniluteicoccus endophyticus]